MKIYSLQQTFLCKPISFGHKSAVSVCTNAPDTVFLKNSFEARTEIREKDGNILSGYIVKENDFVGPSRDAEKYKLIANSLQYSYMVIYKDRGDNALYVSELYADKNKKQTVRGAGTEMLKFAVRKSMERGFEGKLNLKAAGIEYPCVFYYKNNFRTKFKTERAPLDAAMDYCARTNDSFSRLRSSDDIAVAMQLNKNNAQALLDDKRMYLERSSKKMGEMSIDIKNIDGNSEKRDFIIDYADLNDNSSVIQLIDKNADSNAQFAMIELARESADDQFTVKDIKIPPVKEYKSIKNILLAAAKSI